MMPVFHHGSVETIESSLMGLKAPIARENTVRVEAEMHNCWKNARRVVISTLPLYAIKWGQRLYGRREERPNHFGNHGRRENVVMRRSRHDTQPGDRTERPVQSCLASAPAESFVERHDMRGGNGIGIGKDQLCR